VASSSIAWLMVLAQVPSQPSRHRVAVWRELRRAGAVPISAGAWGLPDSAAVQPFLDRAAELCRRGGGTLAVMAVTPRDEESEQLIRSAYVAARLDEWAEFERDCGKYEAEIAKEVTQRKFTFGELEEEEQSLDRLRRWHRDLKRRDLLTLPEAAAAEQRLRACEQLLDDYAAQVYDAMRQLAPATTTDQAEPEPS
jgi:hypothetical protein